jgi:hypothetical protein
MITFTCLHFDRNLSIRVIFQNEALKNSIENKNSKAKTGSRYFCLSKKRELTVFRL